MDTGTPSKNDKALVESLQRGDVRAFDQLFGNYAKRLYAFGFKYLRSKEDAEGLVQDVFMKIWENRKKLNKDSSFKSYLFTIAYNDICSIFRKRTTKREFQEEFTQKLTGSVSKTEESVDYKSVLEEVDRLIEQLPENQKKVLLRRKNQGLSSKEIAEELKLSPRTVDNYMSAAIKFLKSRLTSDDLAIVLFITLWIV
jgi:RNA polymerase sigma-70 factor (ECF subfamily)